MSSAQELEGDTGASSPSVSIRQNHFMQRMDVERINFNKLFRDLRKHVDVGVKLYQAKRTDSDARFYDLFESLNILLGSIQKSQEVLSKGCPNFDFINLDGSRVKGNGYRTLLFLLSSVLQPLHNCLQKAAKERGGVFYSSVDHYNSIASHCRALQGMEVAMRYSVQLMEASTPPELFNSGELCQILTKAVASEYMCRDEFYGRCLGIQYTPTLKPLLKMIGIGMASYEKWYNAEKDDSVIKQVLQSLWKGKEYLQNPVHMGLKLDSLTNECSVQFVKAFWSLMEQDAVKGAMKLVAQSIGVRSWLEVPARDITVQGSKGEVNIKPPHIGVGYKPLRLLLLSHRWREGQERTHHGRKEVAPPASGLLIHMHGGGYVAQSPSTHEFYLRQWSLQLDVPIVSIDYSLAPEAPYPRALEECVLAYAWILLNKEQLGTTAERIVLVGDSAGGNFAFTVSMKLKELGLRMPDSIVSIYPNVNASTSATPSRISALWDPILPLGVMLACQAAYTGQLPSPETLRLRKESRSKILKAQGYYLPDPDAKKSSPTLERIRSFSLRRGNRGRGTDSSDGSKSKRKSSNGPPPRPPPPGATSLKYASDTNPQDNDNGIVESFQEVDLGVPGFSDVVVNGKDLESTSSISVKSELSEEQSEAKSNEKASTAMVLPLTTRHSREPDQLDKLSPDEIEALISEVVKTYQDPEVTRDPFMSPLLASDELLRGLPTAHIIGAALDPMLDDAVAMAHKLKSIGQPVTLNVLDHLPHGFLCMVSAGNNIDLSAAQKLCLEYLRKELLLNSPESTKKRR